MKTPIDPTTGFGDSPIPRAGHWSPDVLGPGFEAQALQLLPDEEGEVVATLVRHVPASDPHLLDGTPRQPVFRALYIHGWNDYFFQREMARQVALAGGEFYGLDLRKYGRSWRANQTFGWTTHLGEYDEDISEALNVIGDDLPIVLMGHSTGGLTTALWAHHNPGTLAAVWLNSPWLELQTSSLVRYPTQQAVEIIGAREPRRILPTGGNNFYSRTLGGWHAEDGDMPESYADFATDPSVTGWGINPVWKNEDRVTLAGWLAAVTEGHREVAEGLNIDCPVFVAASKKSYNTNKWSPEVWSSDAVLDVDVIADRAAHLGDRVCIVRLPGIHDLTLSIPPVRRELWSLTLIWLRFAIGRLSPSFADETLAERALRVPFVHDVQLAPW
ncbi:MAG: alpha/beta hydrolase [Actinomycetaceae bacterium]|nr:alpha/beta hydrolase [Actinomycetaceae bacterium]